MNALNFSSSAISQQSFKGGIYSKKDLEVNQAFIQKLHEFADSKSFLGERDDVFDKGLAQKEGGIFTNSGLKACCDKETPANYMCTFSNDSGIGMKDYGISINRYATNSDRALAKNPVEQIEMSFSKNPIHKIYNFILNSQEETKTIHFDAKSKTGIFKNVDFNNPAEVLNIKKIFTQALEDAKAHTGDVIPKKVFKDIKKGISLLG